MTRRALLCALVCVCSSVLLAAQAAPSLTGVWTGSFVVSMDGEQRDETAYLSLVHKGAELTGTAGPSSDEQWPILKGKVDGTKVTFEVQSDGPLIRFTLALVDGRLKGDAIGEQDGQKMTAKLDIGRSKE